MNPTFDLAAGEVLLIDKPKGWTSYDVIRKLQGITKYKKFGHAGTLDPLATGLLIICSGKQTKKISEYQEAIKEYEVEFVLGAVTKTYDSEFEPENFKDIFHVSLEQVTQTINTSFMGVISQKPPIYSAVKIAGKRAYDLARKGQVVDLKYREVTILDFELKNDCKKIEIHGHQVLRLSARIVCTKGTYIRSLIHDLGEKLGVGGYILELRRTKIGQFNVNSAYTIDEIVSKLTK